MNVHILNHPLAAHYLTQLRDERTAHDVFRVVARRLGILLATEATREMRLHPHVIHTPMERHTGSQLADALTAVPVLRAGLSMLDPILDLFPDVSVGYIGLERDHATAIAAPYYAKLPSNMSDRLTLVLDPMLATGGSASNAIDRIKAAGATRILMLCIVAAPEGVRRLEEDHPDVAIYTAAVDRELNDRKYILPGLGDFGDRLYGTG